MELHTCGKPGNPVILLLPEGKADHEAVFSALKGLEKSYFLILPTFEEGENDETRLAALEKALVRDHAGRVWGAYGLRPGATLLLSLLARGAVRVRTLILEGGYTLSTKPPMAERIVCWMGSRDKPAKKAWKELEKQASPASTLTMKKLKKEQDLLSLRPDLMVKQLKKTLGKAVIVSRSTVIMQPVDSVWQRMPVQQTAAVLTETEPTRLDDAHRTVISAGTSPRLKHWSHLTHLEALGLNGTVCTDQVELDAGILNGVAKPLTGLYLGRLQRRRKRALGKDPHAV